MLEVNSEYIWSFDKFFTEVTVTLSRKIVHVFLINQVQSIRVFVHPNEKYKQLQKLIFDQTDVTAESQILLFRESHLLDELKSSVSKTNYPITDVDNPVFLFSKENNNVVLERDSDLPKFPSFPTIVSVEADVSPAKTATACSVGYACKRRVERLSRSSKLTHESVYILTKVIMKELTKLNSKCGHTKALIEYADELFDAVLRGQKTVNYLIGSKETRKNTFKVSKTRSTILLHEPRIE